MPAPPAAADLGFLLRDVLCCAALQRPVLPWLCFIDVQRSVLVSSDGDQVQGEAVVLYFGLIDILQVGIGCNCG